MDVAPRSLALRVIMGLRPQTSLASAYYAMRPRRERLRSTGGCDTFLACAVTDWKRLRYAAEPVAPRELHSRFPTFDGNPHSRLASPPPLREPSRPVSQFLVSPRARSTLPRPALADS
jgi:hypothetical protein